jgi:hypothetical protein
MTPRTGHAPNQPTNPKGSGHPSGAPATGPQALRAHVLKNQRPHTQPPPRPKAAGRPGSSYTENADPVDTSSPTRPLTRSPRSATFRPRGTAPAPKCTAFRTLTIQHDRKSNDMSYLQKSCGGDEGRQITVALTIGQLQIGALILLLSMFYKIFALHRLASTCRQSEKR